MSINIKVVPEIAATPKGLSLILSKLLSNLFLSLETFQHMTSNNVQMKWLEHFEDG